METLEASDRDETLDRARTGLAPGARFHHYLLLEELGRGGMGVVFRARHTLTSQELALKVLTSGTSENARRRFEREVQTLITLQRHPGIVSVHDAGVVDGLLFYAMELISAGSLDEALARQSWPVARCLALVAELARTLHAAHERGVIHRDIKPENVLIDADGRPKLTDFGLAKDLGSSEKLTQTGTLLGTPAYLPPEQLQGRADARSDVYSLGALLYRMLAGHSPFHEADSPAQLFRMILTTPPASLRAAAPGVPPEVARVVHQALEKDPLDRPQTALELAEELGRAGRSPASPAKRRLVQAALLGALLLAVGTGGWWALRTEPEPAGVEPPPRKAPSPADPPSPAELPKAQPAPPAEPPLAQPTASEVEEAVLVEAIALVEQRDYAEARRLLDELPVPIQDLDTLRIRGQLRARDKDFALALIDFEELLARDPKSSAVRREVQGWRARALLGLERYEEAVDGYARALRDHPGWTPSDSFFHYANNAGSKAFGVKFGANLFRTDRPRVRELDRPREAIEYFDLLARRNDAPDRANRPYSYGSLAHAKLQLGDEEGAQEALDRAVSSAPDHFFGYAVRGGWHLKRGRKAAALVDLEKAVLLDPEPESTRERLKVLVGRAREPD